MQILQAGTDGIKGCFLAVAVIPSNSFYLNIFSSELICHLLHATVTSY